jgi:hypothetical protein
MSGSLAPRTVRTLVVNWDTEWSDFTVSVRARACDLYPLQEAVEFWSRGQPAEREAIQLWGEWPRFLEGDDKEIEAELRSRIDELGDSGDAYLALIIVAGQPLEFELSTMLQRLAGDGLPRGEAASRLLRVVAFREGAETPESRSDAQGLIEPPDRPDGARLRLADATVFLTPPDLSAAARARAGVRVFAGLRLLIDLVRAEAERGGPGPGWSLLRPSDASARRVLWLKPPGEGVTDASATLRAQVIDYVERRQQLAREGKTFHFDSFDAALGRLATRAPAQQASALEPSPEPGEPSAQPRHVAAWINSELEAIGQAADTLRADIRRAQVERDGPLRMLERDVADAARALSLTDLGLDANARARLQDRLGEVRARQREHATEAAQQRRRLRDQLAGLGLAGPGAADPAASIGRHEEAAQLRAAHKEWLRLTLNQVPPTTILVLFGCSVLGLYVLLAETVRSGAERWPLEALWLGASRNLWVFLGIYAVVAALLTGRCLRHMQRTRRAAAASAREKADKLRRLLRATIEPSIAYAERSAVAGVLSLVQRRLESMLGELVKEDRHRDRDAAGAGTLTAQIAMLSGVSRRQELTEEARQQFANRVGGQLQTEVPLSGWLSRMVAQPMPLPESPVTFNTLDWAGELQVPSRITLPPNSTVRLEALPAADQRG